MHAILVLLGALSAMVMAAPIDSTAVAETGAEIQGTFPGNPGQCRTHPHNEDSTTDTTGIDSGIPAGDGDAWC